MINLRLFARRLTSKLDLVGELTSVLVFTSLASTLFCFSTVIALAERSLVAGLPRWPSRLVATAAEMRLSIRHNSHTSFAAASDCRNNCYL